MSYLLPAFFLTCFGIFTLFGVKPSLLTSQFINLVFAIIAYIILKKIGPLFLRRNSYLFYWFFIAALVLTHFFGFEAGGARRWINLFFFNFQPSEFIKPFYILFLADFFAKNQKNNDSFSNFIKGLFYFIIPFFIIYKQPDFATALIFAVIYMILFLFASTPKKTWFYLIFFIIIALPINWLTMKDYQKNRIISFVNQSADQKGSSYNAIQAVITVGSGQFFGRGLGLGTQSRLFFLPENHTDFAFSSLVEQFGFLGGMILLILFLALIIFLIRKLFVFIYNQHREENRFNFLLTLGILSLFTFQIFVNIGMNLAIIPVAGIGLPFISYGGSSIIAFFITLALIP